jgi:phage terminase large subunit-like protein
VGVSVCRFIEHLPHIKGRWADQHLDIALEPWQQFHLTTVFGWYVEDEDALSGWARRFRTSYLSVARKNAKTTIASGGGLYSGFASGESGAEVYSGATGRKQAAIAWSIADGMARKSPDLCSEYDIDPRAHRIISESSGSIFEAVSKEADSLEGSSPSFVIIDEFWAHKNSAVYDALETGMGARENPLMWIITTAGNNTSGPCYRMESYVKKVLQGQITDDAFFGIIYTLDMPELVDDETAADDWTDPEVWVKANPNLGVSIFAKDIKNRVNQAKADPIKEAAVKRKRMNLWVGADIAWMNTTWWNACGEPFDLADFHGERCFLGLDLSSRDDIAALNGILERDGHIYQFGRYFLPSDVVAEGAESTHQKYAVWAATGQFILTPGGVVDQDAIKDEILSLSRVFEVVEVPYDPWQASKLALELQAEGATMVEMRPNVGNFSEPMKEWGGLVKSGKFHHGGDPVLTWAVGNVVAHFDRNSNIFPAKESPDAKIDPAIAVIMALGRWMRHQVARSRYEDPDAEVLVV